MENQKEIQTTHTKRISCVILICWNMTSVQRISGNLEGSLLRFAMGVHIWINNRQLYTTRLVSIWSQTIAFRGSQIAKCSAIVCDHMETHFCDRLRSCDGDRRRSQTIAEDRAMFYLLRSSAIVCDRLRSNAIVWSYGNQNSAICDRNVSHNILNSGPRFNAITKQSAHL